jgi:RNA polymerase sigma-70 factor (ECF subfamily)
MRSPVRLVGPIDAQPADPSATDRSQVAERSLVLHAARQGDVRAFATLVDMFYARCLRFALHMLTSRPDAEEAVQDTFVRVYRALPKFREGSAFEPWLFRILANRCYTAGARARRHAQFLEYGDVPERSAGAAYDTRLGWREEIDLALRALPREQREAFLLHHVEELSYDEMSVVTGARVSALKMRVKRACDAMRLRLEEVERDRRA